MPQPLKIFSHPGPVDQNLMKIRLHQVKLSLGYQEQDIPKIVAQELRCELSLIKELKVIRRSVDARSRRSAPHFIVSVELDFPAHLLTKNLQKITEIVEEPKIVIQPRLASHLVAKRPRPVVVGAGPAGLMAALALAEAGLRPLLIERGAAAPERTEQVARFWKGDAFNEESNTLYGEGGAGLFSDGKLTSRSKDRPRVKRFLEALVRCGASPSILIDAEPHVGSDVLAEIVPRMRQLIIDYGGEVRFNCRLNQVFIEEGRLQAVQVNDERIETDACVLATGHSARDVFRMLAFAGVPLEAKSFAIGVRVELPQARVDQAQWHEWAGHPRLGAASFRLTRKEEQDSRSCYSFCMCPGGMVIACASSAGQITTNGMSLSKRDESYANAAFLVPIRPTDIPVTGSADPAILDNYKFQEAIEEKAFRLGGGNYAVPASRLQDFLEGRISKDLPPGRSNQRSVPVDLREILPDFVCATLTSAIPKMLQKMRGVVLNEVILYGAETRSSSPIRVVRGKDGHSTGVRGLFPTGEGAGYAGGIVSSSIDGLRASEAIIRTYLP
ncbi:MAG: hypothetical protein COB67_02045 [SAR324 cluster bacterium]|uniref:Uncharacterized protein n=1 Tax=SAR324 cluster bacterium TaxID=2024889 RepID=A0A2A4TA92_9DELT|nr:MAG: hypothetical protein COB67_02045 [SAR324 cluster bacterium]